MTEPLDGILRHRTILRRRADSYVEKIAEWVQASIGGCVTVCANRIGRSGRYRPAAPMGEGVSSSRYGALEE